MTRHLVALSGGKDSTAMALILAEREPRDDYEYICTPTGNEPEAMFEHWKKLGDLLGKPIRPIMADTLGGLITKQKALPNRRQRWCTRILKIEPFLHYVRAAVPCVTYVGLRADEEDREGTKYGTPIPGITPRFYLREIGWGITEVLDYLKFRGITIPERTDCKLCFFQTLWEWYVLWRDDREGWMEGEAFEALTGYTFRSPGRDTQPAAMKDLRAKFETGYVPKERRRDSIKAMQCRECTL